MSARRLAMAAAPLALLFSACAGPAKHAPAATGCDASWDQATALLRAGLEDYLAGMRRYAVERQGTDTGPAETRTKAKAAEWEAAHRDPFAGACRAWPDEVRACIAAAASAPGLGDCHPDTGALVTSFTDEVVATFLSSPLR